jgi:RHS repeat-associated protein
MRSHGYSAGNWSTNNAYHSDANGNATALMNSSGVLQASYKYNPYGGLISSSGTLAGANTMRFSSKPAIFSTTGAWGFYYYGYRFYDPVNQRWLNRDPLGESADHNLYKSVRNAPGNLYDALGLLTDEQIQQIIQTCTLYGGVAGGIIGGTGGGAGGALLGLPTGPGAVATGAAGAAIGAAEGAVIGSASGAALGAGAALAVHCVQKYFEDDDEPEGGFKKNKEGDCTVANAQYKEALRRLDIKDKSDKAQRLHRHISKQGLKSIEEILDAAKDLGY